MTLSEELHEASVAATGHHADLLRRAADYVAACEVALHCDVCGKETNNPWHFSSENNRHMHACDECHRKAPPAGMQPVPVSTLKWWRELLDINPQDLIPSIEAYIEASRGES